MKRPADQLRDQIAERIWRAEYTRATGKQRLIEWAEVGDNDVLKYLYLAEAILPLVVGCGTPGCTDPHCQYGEEDDIERVEGELEDRSRES